MNWTFLKHEFLLTYRSKKNIPLVIFIGIALLGFCFVFLPNEETKETFYPNEIKSELARLDIDQQFRLEKGHTGIVKFSGVPVYAMNAYSYGMFSAMLASYEDGNATRWLHLRANYLEENPPIYLNDDKLFTDSPFPVKDRQHLHTQTMLRYENYLAKEHPITFNLIYEKTGLQAVQKFMQQYGMLFILFCTIFFSSDIISRSRLNRSVLQGMPLSWYRQLNLKSLSAMFYSCVVLICTMAVGMIIITMLYGFGYSDLHIPTILVQEDFPREVYGYITIASYLGKIALVALVLIYLFTRLNVVFSLLFKNEWLVLLFSTVILFSEKLYMTRTTRELFGVDISLFPQTYFDFGKVLTGEKNFLLNTSSITVAKGLAVLLITIAVLEVVIFALSRVINKRRFYQNG